MELTKEDLEFEIACLQKQLDEISSQAWSDIDYELCARMVTEMKELKELLEGLHG